MAAGNATLWKPSPSTPLCSIAVTKIVSRVLKMNGVPGAVAGLITGGKDVGEAVVESEEVDLGNPFIHQMGLYQSTDASLLQFRLLVLKMLVVGSAKSFNRGLVRFSSNLAVTMVCPSSPKIKIMPVAPA